MTLHSTATMLVCDGEPVPASENTLVKGYIKQSGQYGTVVTSGIHGTLILHQQHENLERAATSEARTRESKDLGHSKWPARCS